MTKELGLAQIAASILAEIASPVRFARVCGKQEYAPKKHL